MGHRQRSSEPYTGGQVVSLLRWSQRCKLMATRTVATAYVPSMYIPSAAEQKPARSSTDREPPIRRLGGWSTAEPLSPTHPWESPNYVTGLAGALVSMVRNLVCCSSPLFPFESLSCGHQTGCPPCFAPGDDITHYAALTAPAVKHQQRRAQLRPRVIPTVDIRGNEAKRPSKGQRYEVG